MRDFAYIGSNEVIVSYVYDMFDIGKDIIKEVSSDETHLIGYFDGRLLEVLWCDDDNWIRFSYINLRENKISDDDEEKLIDFITSYNNDGDGLVVELYTDEDGWLLSEWYLVK